MHREFQDIVEHLRSDGALRDFYIHAASQADWNAVLSRVGNRLEPDCFTVDGESRELPASFDAIEQTRTQASPCLSIPVAGAYVKCHFFCDEQIEMDFRPEDYRAPERWSALCEFFQDIVDSVGKPGIITYENAENDVIEKFEPKA